MFNVLKVTIVAIKIFEDFDTFQTAIPLKERFFQLKPNVLGMNCSDLALTYIRHLVSIGPDNAHSAKDS